MDLPRFEEYYIHEFLQADRLVGKMLLYSAGSNHGKNEIQTFHQCRSKDAYNRCQQFKMSSLENREFRSSRI